MTTRDGSEEHGPDETPNGRPDVALEHRVATLLRLGALLAVAVVLVGAVLLLVRHWNDPLDHQVFRGEPRALRTPVGIVQEAMRPSGRAIVDLGLLLLVLTPITRVAFSIPAFLKRGDPLYAVVTAFVLAVLLYSLLGGLRWTLPDRERSRGDDTRSAEGHPYGAIEIRPRAHRRPPRQWGRPRGALGRRG